MNAFDMQDEYDRYRSEGGRVSFADWAARYGDDYGCNGEWLVTDYFGHVNSAEQRADAVGASYDSPSFRAWLEAQPAAYREHHMDAEVAA